MAELTYKASGVDTAAAEALVESYRRLARSTNPRHVLAGVGGFVGLIGLPPGYVNPVLTACTDGVGTKLRLLIANGRGRTAGMDAAAMCLNDLATSGAQPLFMLDYLAVGKLDAATAEAVVAGFARYCRQAGCALLGGETAEMPGFYPPGDYDVAGFAVGVVERDKIVDGRRCRAGDIVVGLASPACTATATPWCACCWTGACWRPKTYPGGDGPLLNTCSGPPASTCPWPGPGREGAKAIAHITGGGCRATPAAPCPIL